MSEEILEYKSVIKIDKLDMRIYFYELILFPINNLAYLMGHGTIIATISLKKYKLKLMSKTKLGKVYELELNNVTRKRYTRRYLNSCINEKK